MLLSSGNPFKCHEEVLYLQSMILSHLNVLTFSPLTGECSEGLDAFRFFFKQHTVHHFLLYVHCNDKKNCVHRLGQPKSRNDFYNLRITENIDIFDRNRIYSDQRDKPVMPICRLMTNFLISHAVFPIYCLKFGVSRGENYQDVGTFLIAPEALDHRRGKRQQRQLLGLLDIEFSHKSMSPHHVD